MERYYKENAKIKGILIQKYSKQICCGKKKDWEELYGFKQIKEKK